MLLSTTVVSMRILRPCTTSLARAICTIRSGILMDHNWSHRRAPAAHGFRVGHLGSTDTGEFAIHQIGADLALQYRIAPVADVLQNQQSQHHLRRETQSAAP